MKRKLGFVLVGALLLALVGELGARWILGLGDPPLTVRDPEIEYLFAPNQDVRRFGNRVVYNNVSMRSADRWSMARERPEELRVLVLGDSVINGGALTDHARLATTIAQETLDRPARPVRVGNVSAGSWGPENLLAYVERFGLFDADLAVVVLSTHDLRDVRTFPDDLGPDFPLARPVSALWEGLARYLAPRLGLGLRPPPAAPPPPHAIDRSVAALQKLFELAEANGVDLVVLHHPERDEPDQELVEDAAILRAAIERMGRIVIPMSVWLGSAAERQQYYRDEIHINEAGQRIYGEVLICLIEYLGSPRSCTKPRR
jgi:hypothetical protein